MKDLTKIIEIKGADIIPLKVLAAKAGKDLKNYIQDLLTAEAQKQKL